MAKFRGDVPEDRTASCNGRCVCSETGGTTPDGNWESCSSSKCCRLDSLGSDCEVDERNVERSASVNQQGTDAQSVEGDHAKARTGSGIGDVPHRVDNVLEMPSSHRIDRGAHAEPLRRRKGSALKGAIGSNRWEDAYFMGQHRSLRLIWHRGQPRGDDGGNFPRRPPPWEPRRGAA